MMKIYVYKHNSLRKIERSEERSVHVGEREIGEEEDMGDAGEKKKKNQRRRVGEREKKVFFFFLKKKKKK
jgi:hypothetical protein